ncbi:MAG: 2-hydroxyacid dehydrogenase [Alphaproteobacteria bacterium]
MKPKILVTRRLPDDVMTRIDTAFTATHNPADAPMAADALIAGAKGQDGLLVTITEPVTAEIIDALPKSIKIISTFSVGYEHIDVNAAAARNIIITNTPDVLTDATADLAMMLILGITRRAHEGEQAIRQNKWPHWAPTKGVESGLGVGLRGRRLGILGMGRIGQALAARARAFGLEIHYHNRRRLPDTEEQSAIWHDTAERLLGISDILSLNAAATQQTHDFLNADRIALMPDNAFVINTARGALINDDALIAALTSGKLRGAGLDVFAGEPVIDPRYRDLPNTFLMPHLGSATEETRSAMGHRAVDNLEAFFNGSTTIDPVAPQEVK